LFRSGFSCRLSTALQLLGRVGDAVRAAEEGLRHARESKHVYTVGFALLYRGALLPQLRRELEIVRARGEELIALSEEYGFATWDKAARFHHGWALAELGQLEHGVAEMEASLIRWRQEGGFPWQQYLIALLAQCYARMGRAEEALGMLNEALEHIERSGEKVHQAEMLRLKGELLLMRYGGAAEEAERYFHAALEVARAQEARWWELRATVSLARLLTKQDRRDEARAMLAEIYGWFTEGFDTADLKEAKALLDELSV
jgi:adenylate cyclase